MGIDYEKVFFDNIIDSVIAVDKEGKIREANLATLKLLGYKKEEIISQPLERICPTISFEGLKDNLPLQEQELIYLNKEREKIPVSVNITNRTVYPDDTVFLARNISKTKELINELTISREELKTSYTELEASKDELVRSEKLAYTGRIAASIAHEIRNPLSNVTMSIQQLKKICKSQDSDGNGLRHLEIVKKNAERINYLITELLNCARPPKLNLQSYDIHKLLRNVLDTARPKIRLQKIKLVCEFTSKPSTIRMDKEQMERALLNIISNAIEAMPKGGRLTIFTEPTGNFFVTKIQDTGKGIPEKDIIKIFDLFFSTKSGGVGLGLTICYGIIVSHGGTIEVESKRKRGSIFTVSLPR